MCASFDTFETHQVKVQTINEKYTKLDYNINIKVNQFEFVYILLSYCVFYTCHTFHTDRVTSSLGMVANTAPFCATGHPALTINACYSEGLPVGMMMVGKHLDEQKILNVAYAFEKLRDAEK